jgi:hypothetical protein
MPVVSHGRDPFLRLGFPDLGERGRDASGQKVMAKMADATTFREIALSPNQYKANFDSAYDGPDPREYFRRLGGLDYTIPDLAKEIFRPLIRRRETEMGRSAKVLDLGCSYGVNAALIRCPISIQRLADRYGTPAMASLDPEQVAALDQHYFRAWPSQTDAGFIGVDVSDAAVSYAVSVGLLDGGISSNLEKTDPSPEERRLLHGVDVIISTGAVGYITERTFRRVLDCQDDNSKLTVVSFVLRMFPYTPIIAELGRFGLVTEKLEGVTFVQRRFNSQSEFEATIAHLEELGMDTRSKEADGLLHAELFVSRSPEEARRVPLAELISVTNGANRNYGRRYRQIESAQPGTLFV